jgi:predicted DNA-binding transcriptional regulator AlpA
VWIIRFDFKYYARNFLGLTGLWCDEYHVMGYSFLRILRMKDELLTHLLVDILAVLKNLELIAKASLGTAQTSEQWLDTFDMLQKFHISRSTLHRLKKNGDLVPSKLGKKDVFLLSEVEKVLKNGSR